MGGVLSEMVSQGPKIIIAFIVIVTVVSLFSNTVIYSQVNSDRNKIDDLFREINNKCSSIENVANREVLPEEIVYDNFQLSEKVKEFRFLNEYTYEVESEEEGKIEKTEKGVWIRILWPENEYAARAKDCDIWGKILVEDEEIAPENKMPLKVKTKYEIEMRAEIQEGLKTILMNFKEVKNVQ